MYQKIYIYIKLSRKLSEMYLMFRFSLINYKINILDNIEIYPNFTPDFLLILNSRLIRSKYQSHWIVILGKGAYKLNAITKIKWVDKLNAVTKIKLVFGNIFDIYVYFGII